MTFWERLRGKSSAPSEPQAPPAPEPPEVLVMLGLLNSRFFFEERLISGTDPQPGITRLALQGKLIGIRGVREVRLYDHYVAVTHPGTPEEEIGEAVLSTLSRHFSWPDSLHITLISDMEVLHRLDQQRHPEGRKWVLGNQPLS